jgi:DNA-binding MarR family transcriptional regulator/GNAT superfamily N-acetyltransferase
MTDTATIQRIEAIRRFSRFYTRQIGLLHEGFLNTPFTLTEGRVIYELAHHERTTATHLAEELGLDAGYLSRVLRSLQRRGLLAKEPSEEDRRSYLISLTEPGQDAFSKLNASSRSEIGEMLSTLAEEDQDRLVHAMSTVETLLGAEPEHRVPYILRPHQPGDLGWVVQRQAMIYASEYGWNEEFEALAAEVAAHFLRNFDPRLERSWIAEKDGENVGAVFLVKHPERDGVAKLRMLFVDARARGLGIGRRLVQECARFARQAGYHTITLWTQSELTAARSIYESEGYVLVHEETNHAFGHDLVSETWELTL